MPNVQGGGVNLIFRTDSLGKLSIVFCTFPLVPFLMPVIGLISGGFNVSGAFFALDGQTYASQEAAAAAGAGTLNYGMFIQKIIDFLIISLCIFLVVRLVNKLLPKKPAKAARKCPYCMQEIDDQATRCPHCTSRLEKDAETA